MALNPCRDNSSITKVLLVSDMPVIRIRVTRGAYSNLRKYLWINLEHVLNPSRLRYEVISRQDTLGAKMHRAARRIF
jgi:hypothetical protein